MQTFRITGFEGDPNDLVKEVSDEDRFYIRRAALVSVGALYEDFPGPLSDEMISSAEKILAERGAT